jgi:hypothetical protein
MRPPQRGFVQVDMAPRFHRTGVRPDQIAHHMFIRLSTSSSHISEKPICDLFPLSVAQAPVCLSSVFRDAQTVLSQNLLNFGPFTLVTTLVSFPFASIV